MSATEESPEETIRALVEIISRATRQLVEKGGAGVPIAREGADTRAAIPVTIAQATGQDGTLRYVKVRALGGDQRLDAEVAAHRHVLRALGPAPANPQMRDAYMVAYERLLDRRTVIEEAARMIVEPPDLPVATVEKWNDAAIQQIHLAGVQAEEYPAELIAAQLARMFGGALPPAPGGGAGEPQSDLDDLDNPPQPS